MANLTSKITLTSTDSTSDSLDFSVVNSLTVTNPTINLARVSVLHTGSGTEIITAAAVNPHTYFYAKNIDNANYVICRTAAGAEWGRLAPGESMFMAVAAAVGIEFLAVVATCVVEYGYWTKT
tara:strand:+ start:273 stop:641 length:369 start_codon:yes stop_codon:yes gene_type:complete